MNVDILTLVNCEIKMMLPVFLGYFVCKIGILTEEFSKNLSKFMLYCLHPFYTVTAICSIEKTPETVSELWKIMLISLCIHLFVTALAILALIPMKDIKRKNILRAGVIFRNAGFFGIPVLTEIYGAKGAFWGAANVIVFNFLFWTLCLMILNRANGEKLTASLRSSLNIGTASCVIGLLLFLSGIRIYTPLFDGMKSIGNACTPVSLILIGGIIARQPLGKLFVNLPAIAASVISMTALPLGIMLIMKAIGMPDDYTVFGTVIMALPMASNIVAYSESKDIDPPFAAQTVGISVLLTMATMPLLSFIL